MKQAAFLSRRSFIKVTGLAAGAFSLNLPSVAMAGSSLVNPYRGSIPFQLFPLLYGTYKTPVIDNWHANREGQIQPWSHQSSSVQRAHDGVDIYPVNSLLPAVFSPLNGTVAAVLTQSSNTAGSAFTYYASSKTPPPHDYSGAVDQVANLPLYGNFVWIYCTDNNSAKGYFVFFCHLQYEAAIQSLFPDQVLSPASKIGVLGDTGNAQGSPQLHTEIHYPAVTFGTTTAASNYNHYSCTKCAGLPPGKTLTSIDSAASLKNAPIRRN